MKSIKFLFIDVKYSMLFYSRLVWYG